MSINRTTSLALLTALCAVALCPTPTQAALDRQRLLRALRAADHTMAQGIMAYSRITTDPGEMARPGKPARIQVTLAYGRNAHLRLKTIAVGRDGQQFVCEEVYDGTTDAVFYPGRAHIDLSGDLPRALDPVYKMIGIGAGPCCVSGRGLSTLRNMTLTRSGRGWMLRGAAADGTQLTALLDARHDALAQWIERRRGGKLIERWHLESPIRTTGVWIASHADLDLYSGGERIYHDAYALRQSRFTAPIAGYDRLNIPSSVDTFDSRTGKTTPALDKTLLAAGTSAPDFQATTADGRRIKLSDLWGETVVLKFWATWCPPCQASLPETAEIARRYADRHVTVLAVNVWDDEQAFKEWLPKHADYAAIRFAIVPKSAGIDVARALYHVTGIPTTYIISAEGKIVGSFIGYEGPSHRLEEALSAAGGLPHASNFSPP